MDMETKFFQITYNMDSGKPVIKFREFDANLEDDLCKWDVLDELKYKDFVNIYNTEEDTYFSMNKVESISFKGPFSKEEADNIRQQLVDEMHEHQSRTEALKKKIETVYEN